MRNSIKAMLISFNVIRTPRFNPKDSPKIRMRISIILLLIFVSMTFLLTLHLLPSSLLLQEAHAQQATFSSPIPLDNGVGDQLDSHIASSGNTAYMTWTSEVNGISKILFAKTSNGGINFESMKTLSDDGAEHFAFLSDIAVSGNNVYVVWTDVTDESDIFFIKSTDGGDSFTEPIKLNDGTQPNGRLPRIAVSEANVYVAWEDFSCCPSGLESEIFFAVSTDDGDTFSDPSNVSNNPGTLSLNPSIAALGANVHIIWRDADTNNQNSKIVYAKSNNAGVSFSNTVTLANPESRISDIQVLEDNVYVVYSQSEVVNGNLDSEIFIIKSTDGGSTFSSPINLSPATEVPDPNPLQIGRTTNPHIDLSGDNVAITLDERVAGLNPHSEVFFVYSTDGGITFTDPMSISGNLGEGSTLNDVSISGTNVYSTWNTLEQDFNVYFAAGIITPPVTPEEGIENLIDTINNLNLKSSIKTSLNGPLHNAIKLLTDNNPSNDNDVCNKLDSFLAQLNAKEANGQLTTLQAEELREQATAIKTSLGCPSANPFASGSLQADNSRATMVLPF